MLRSDEHNLKVEMACANLTSPLCDLNPQWRSLQSQLHRFRTRDELESEYFELFEVTRKKAPCPLYESFYRDEDRNETMAELVRFYNFFGLTLGSSAKEMPDHLKVELEFLHYLSFLETTKSGETGSLESLARAQRDFFERHLNIWTPQLWKRIDSQNSTYYSSLASMTRKFLIADYEFFRGREGI